MKNAIILALAVAALGACTQTGPEVSYGNDMLPSAEVTAFQRVDARLGYRDARIEYDTRNCAIYQGTGPDGRVYSEVLRDEDNTTICR